MLKKFTTRLAALFVALSLALTLAPFTVLAEEPDPSEPVTESIEASTEAGTEAASETVTSEPTEDSGKTDATEPTEDSSGTDATESTEETTEAVTGETTGTIPEDPTETESTETDPATPASGVTITVAGGEPGVTALYIPQDATVTDEALLAGVSAADENGVAVAVTVADVGGLDCDTPQPKGEPGNPEAYIITYAAEGAEAVTRECFVTVAVVPLAVLADNANYSCESVGGINTLTIKTDAGTTAWRTDTSIGSSPEATAAFIDSVVIMSGVTTIGDNAFALCYDLTSLDIADSVTEIGGLAFSNCTALRDITFKKNAPPNMVSSAVFSNVPSSVVAHVPDGMGHIYEAALKKAGFSGTVVAKIISPGVPRNVRAVAGDGWVRLSWDVPEQDGGAAITGYTIRYNPEDDGTGNIIFMNTIQNLDPSIFTYTVTTNLTNGTEHEFQIVAVNSAGDGTAASVKATPMAAPTYSISATPDALDFGSPESPYAPPAAQTVTVTNTGTGAVTLDQPISTNYIIGAFSPDRALDAANDTAAFTVQPKAGLAVGRYNETISITGSDGTSASVSLTFEVTAAKPNVAFTVQGSGINLAKPADLVFAADNGLLDSAAFSAVQFIRLSDNQTSTVINNGQYGLTFGWAGGRLTIPAAVFGQHSSGNPLMVGNYRALLTFTLGGDDFQYEVDFGMTNIPEPKPDSKPSRPSSGHDDNDDDSDSDDAYNLPVSDDWLDPDEARPLAATSKRLHLDYARTLRNNCYGVRGQTWAALNGLIFYHDTMLGGVVQVRTYFADPGLFTKDARVSGYLTGPHVTSIRALFERWFSNKIRVIHFDQPGQWEHPIKVAARVDLAGMDTTRLVFYSYDPKTNCYRKLEAPAYWIDTNGYLRFQTGYAGEIVITEGKLEKGLADGTLILTGSTQVQASANRIMPHYIDTWDGEGAVRK